MEARDKGYKDGSWDLLEHVQNTWKMMSKEPKSNDTFDI